MGPNDINFVYSRQIKLFEKIISKILLLKTIEFLFNDSFNRTDLKSSNIRIISTIFPILKYSSYNIDSILVLTSNIENSL